MTLRDLPSVDRLATELSDGRLPRMIVVEVARHAIEEARSGASNGDISDPRQIAQKELERLSLSRPHSVVNATGVILHTNLGRAVLSAEATAAASAAYSGYGNVEFDNLTGERGPRGPYLRRLASSLTGAEDALVVNNNAGALFLVLLALAAGKPVPVSRGEMIEIGGSYRLPELMAATGARLVEIGTTNRTRLADYRETLDQGPSLFLKVHPSNYRVEGFTEETTIAELVRLGHEHEVTVVFDAGSGLLDATTPWLPGPTPGWLSDEPGIRQAVEAGADLTLFSGDKLLGGPQAGIIVGRRDLVGRLSKHPGARALRIDAATGAALTATLEAYASDKAHLLPLWTMATLTHDELEARIDYLIAAAGGERVEGASTLGAGSAPGAQIPTPILSIKTGEAGFLGLLRCDPPVLARRQGGRLLIDLRTVPPELDDHVAASLQAACR